MRKAKRQSRALSGDDHSIAKDMAIGSSVNLKRSRCQRKKSSSVFGFSFQQLAATNSIDCYRGLPS
jgi:hypothetical protein